MSSFGHGFVVLFGIGALGPMLALVPMPVLAAVLVNAGSKMLVPAEVVHCLRVRRSDIMPYATTVLGMLTVGLAEGVMMGMAASLIFSGANWDQPQTCRMSFEPAFSVRTAVDLHTEAELWSMDKARLIRLLRGSYDVELQHNLASYATPDDLGRTCPECDGW
jgi:MFS superfamily sulfate permease-like transporter